METMIWAFCSMAVLILILIFLPLGYTLKGKFIIGVFCFILSVGGLVAIPTFSFWQTTFMLCILIFFVAFILYNRLGSILYKVESTILEHVSIKETPETNAPYVEGAAITTKANRKEQLNASESRQFVPTLHDKGTTPNDNYLEEIESLLELDPEKGGFELRQNYVDQEELHELPPIWFEQENPAVMESQDEEIITNSLFDFLLTKKEVEINLKDGIGDIEMKKSLVVDK